MSEQFRPDEPAPAAPPPPALGPAAQHRAAAESAAGHHDFDTALRERFRAVVRGLEQGGVLEVQRSRTARETAAAAGRALPGTEGEFDGAAHSFDEIVYGGRPASPDEYQRLSAADRYSLAPPPPPDPVDQAESAPSDPSRRRLPPLPQLLRDKRFWAVVLGILVVALIVYMLMRLSATPSAPPQPSHPPPPPDRPDLPDPDFGRGRDSIFDRFPPWLAYGGAQALIFAAIVVWWRGRRRGAVVGEPRPVEVAAGELLTGQAALYRRTKDRDHVAAKLRQATLRRIRGRLDLRTDTPPDRVCALIGGRIGADPRVVGAALYGPVPDDTTLEYIAAQLDWIDSEIG
ncbi:hypothetical protein NONO_c00530 [Nocardia nova SH22a]|uniref:Protein-glutamine gamma-glutamyltransferase-like C-terminal domain-containing protein n=1 Tax=Nocardia nova SH22a TaxID=1415166 RepID=W5T7H4_9NOCA|nr:DUF4129 domain-containing protein [Nocardia nova]AHH14873.1 hypothetical protein NONO_c00530 [Nocardia nova SH22a]